MSTPSVNPYFHLSFRISITISSVSFLLLTLIFWVHLDLSEALQFALFSAIAVHVVSYFITRRFLQKRVRRMQASLENLANKHFDEVFDEVYRKKDELDDVILQLSKTSLTIEKELQRLNRLENYRKEFIGDISHELKTPIFAIQGFIETLLDGALEDERVNKDFLRKAMRNVNRLIILTRDLMEISKLETGELRSDIQVIQLHEIIQEITDNLQFKAKAETVSLSILPYDTGINVMADRNQVRQVLINLIENAIKYNKPGGSVAVGVKMHAKNPSKVLVFVSDTGLGIEPRDIPRVTERFYRIDKSRAREKGGTGLGLSIVKHILEAHNEQLYIESTINKGSTFSFSLQNADRVST